MIETKAKIIEKNILTSDVVEFVFELEKKMEYTPGQFFSIKIEKDGKIQYRSYSIANHPDDPANIIRMVIKLLDGGLASEYLRDKKVGEEVELRGSAGMFGYKSDNVKDIYLICTGTGIVPLMNILESQLTTGNQSNINLIFGNRYNGDIFWEDNFKELSEKYPNFHYEITLSRPTDEWSGHRGYVQELLTDKIDYNNSHFYLCGIPAMVEETKNFLIEKNTPKENIFEEKYVSVGKMMEERSGKQKMIQY